MSLQRPTIYEKFERGAALLFELRSTDLDKRSRELAFRTLFLGTLGLSLVALLVVCSNYFFLHLDYLLPRILIISGVIIVLLGLYVFALTRHLAIAASGLLLFYFIAATAAIWLWGVETPIGSLLFALVVIFAGILLGPRYSLYTAALVIIIQGVFVWGLTSGNLQPDTSWSATPARYYDVIVYAIILGNLALVSWLFNRSMTQSLYRAQRSETALRRQKKILEIKVEQRTRQVQAAHIEHIQELYRFAELGHMSVALLHDMANYLSVLSLDIEDLKEARENRSSAMQRVQQSIQHLNSLVGQVRNQIQGETAITRFNIADEINQVTKILEYKAQAANVAFTKNIAPERDQLFYTGGINHFWQIMMNIISNAIDAYSDTSGTDRKIIIDVNRDGGTIFIQVQDFGKGIPEDVQQKIFDPFYSTKKDGTGIGLAIAKRMVEKDLRGNITVASKPDEGTAFMIAFPVDADDDTSKEV
jgi:signal transduction histidine kinase